MANSHPVNAFLIVDWLLLSIGCKISSTSKFATCLNMCIRIFCICSMFTGIWSSITRFDPKNILFNIVEMSFSISILIIMLILVMKRSSLSRLIKIIGGHLNINDCRKLGRTSILLVVFSMAPSIYVFSTLVYHVEQVTYLATLSFLDNFNWLQSVVTWSLHIVFSLLPFFPASMALYVHLLHCLQQVELNFYDSLINDEFLKYNSMQMLTIINERRYLTHSVKSKFNGTLNVLPFTWFTYLFCSASGFIKTFGEPDQQGFEWFYIAQGVYFFSLISYLVGIMVSDLMNAKITVKSEQLISKIINSAPNPNRNLLIRELKCDCGLQLNSWDMMPLNKGFLLSFLSALVTFSVLFIELSKRLANT